jgi:hypothetical protein
LHASLPKAILQRSSCNNGFNWMNCDGRHGFCTYGIATTGRKQVWVQGADCDAVDGHPGFHHARPLLPLVSCKPRHLLCQCLCFSMN